MLYLVRHGRALRDVGPSGLAVLDEDAVLRMRPLPLVGPADEPVERMMVGSHEQQDPTGVEPALPPVAQLETRQEAAG